MSTIWKSTSHNVDMLEERLNYHFRDHSLLEDALTHPSYGGDHHTGNYQRLEFLGDAVLELAISRYLYFELPNVPEGRLTRMRAELVREETLSEAARRLELGRLVRLSVGEERSGGREKPSILCDIMEAVLGAVYLDGGMEEANRIVKLALGDRLRPEALEDHLDDKSQLQALLQSMGSMPEYDFEAMEGPPHRPVFTYTVTAAGAVLGRGQGQSKQAAQQAAAKDALQVMRKNRDENGGQPDCD